MSYTRYEKLIKIYRKPNGEVVISDPPIYKKGNVIESNIPSEDICNMIPQYRWIEVPLNYEDVSTFICDNYVLYSIEKKQVSTDGKNWQDTTPIEIRKKDKIEENSEYCDYYILREWFLVEYNEENEDTFICENNIMYEKYVLKESIDMGATWNEVQPLRYRKGNIIEGKENICEQIEANKLKMILTIDREFVLEILVYFNDVYYQYFKQASPFVIYLPFDTKEEFKSMRIINKLGGVFNANLEAEGYPNLDKIYSSGFSNLTINGK